MMRPQSRIMLSHFKHSLLTWNLQERRQVMKSTLAVLIATALYVYVPIDRGYWIVFATLWVMQTNVNEGSFELAFFDGLNRIIGSTIGVALGLIGHYFIADVLLQNRIWLLFPVLSVITVCGIFLHQRYHGFRMTAISAVMVMLLGLNDLQVSHLAFSRAANILLGVFIAVVVHLLFWPYSETQTLNAHERDWLSLSMAYDDDISNHLFYKKNIADLDRALLKKKLFNLLKKMQRSIKTLSQGYRRDLVDKEQAYALALHEVMVSQDRLMASAEKLRPFLETHPLRIDMMVLHRMFRDAFVPGEEPLQTYAALLARSSAFKQALEALWVGIDALQAEGETEVYLVFVLWAKEYEAYVVAWQHWFASAQLRAASDDGFSLRLFKPFAQRKPDAQPEV
jgi:uncharacterized membrane protein YccC